MTPTADNRRRRAPPPPLDSGALDRLAIAYVGRYATTQAKLRAYLARKLRERGWAGEGVAPVDAIVERIATLGYVDDRGFAAARSTALARRGFGPRRRTQALDAAGIAPDYQAAARALLDEQGEAPDDWASALAFARRRRLGPFAREAADPDARRRGFAAMMRAGHAPELARRILSARPGEVPEPPC